MCKNLGERIALLRRVSCVLNEATDAANNAMGLVERFLHDECSIGLPVAVTVGAPRISSSSRGSGGVVLERVALVYDRVDGRFRIGIRVERATQCSSAGQRAESMEKHLLQSWISSPRELKLRTFPELPRLLFTLAERAKELAGNVARVHTVAAEINDALKACQVVGTAREASS